MKLQFIKLSPAGNMTILFLDQVQAYRRKKVASRLLDYTSLHGEQVGFIVRKGQYFGLEMMGGEFCGNATRSLAALLIDRGLVDKEEDEKGSRVRLLSSGIDGPLDCYVKKASGEYSCSSKIHMPRPLSLEALELELEDSLFK